MSEPSTDIEDFHRGYRAFLAKQKPEFLGR